MKSRFFARRNTLAAAALVGVITILTGCAAAVVGGAATTAVVATDRRTTGEQVEDKAIDLKANSEARQVLEGKEGRVNVSSYAGQVLLTGDVPSTQEQQQIEQRVASIEKVTSVVNHLRVGPPTELSVRTNDSWLSTKVMSTLVNTKLVPTRTLTLTTERGVVYLQGRLTPDEGQRAAKAAAGVPGVSKVVKLFQYISPESLIDPKDQTPVPITEQKAPEPLDKGPEAMPVL